MDLFPDTNSDDATSAGARDRSDDSGHRTAYEVLARKYRPRSFDDLLGHEAMVRTLQNAFAADRIAHAYILTGVRGVGKTTTARILARALNYHLPDGPDRPRIEMPEEGRHCRAIAEGRHQDVIEMDAASRTGVGDIRELIESVRYAPVAARYKVYIIDEVHMLSNSAFNALLKTLEEPPPHVKFIFATTEIRKLPVTVLSRCQRFDLRRFDNATLSAYLETIAAKEGVTIAPEGLGLIARAAEGSVRDALSLLDQAIIQETDLTAEIGVAAIKQMLGLADRASVWSLLTACLGGEAATALRSFKGQYDAGTDPVTIMRDLLEITHLLTRVKAAGVEAADTGPAGSAERADAADLAERLEMNVLTRCWTLLMQGLSEVQIAPDPVAAAEMALIKLCYIADLPTPDEALRQLGRLEGTPASVSTALPAAKQQTGNAAAEQAAPAVSTPDRSRAEAHPGAMPQRDGTKGGGLYGSNSAGQVPEREELPHAHASADNPNAAAIDSDIAATHSENIAPRPGGVPIKATPVAITSPRAPCASSNDAMAGCSVQSLEDIVQLAIDHRDGVLREEIEKYVSLVALGPRSLEFFPMPGAPQNLDRKISKSLEVWTGERWMVTTNRAARGDETLRLRRNALIRSHPLMQAVAAAYPELNIEKNMNIKEIPLQADDRPHVADQKFVQ